MNREEVRRLHEVIERRITKAQSDMVALRNTCHHPAYTTKYLSSTGYSEPTIYWTEHRCLDCGKMWNEDYNE